MDALHKKCSNLKRKPNMRIVNTKATVRPDNRTGSWAPVRNVRGVRTPYGVFRSVAVCRDVIMTQHPEEWLDAIRMCVDKEHVAKVVYARIYSRCKNKVTGWEFESPSLIKYKP